MASRKLRIGGENQRDPREVIHTRSINTNIIATSRMHSAAEIERNEGSEISCRYRWEPGNLSQRVFVDIVHERRPECYPIFFRNTTTVRLGPM